MQDNLADRINRLETAQARQDTRMEERWAQIAQQWERSAEFHREVAASLAALRASLESLRLEVRTNGHRSRITNATWAGGGISLTTIVAALGKAFGVW